METEHPISRMSRFCGLLCVMLVTVGCDLAVAQRPLVIYRGDPRYAGARSSSLGGAISADNRDIESMFSNPASLNTITYSGAIVDHKHDWDWGVFDETLGLRVLHGEVHSLGIGARYTHTSTNKTGSIDFRQFSADIAYSYQVFTDFNVGFLAGIRQGRTDERSIGGSSVSLGILYTPTPAVSYGMVIRDLGRSIEYTLQDSGAPTSIGVDEVHPASFELSSTLRFPSKGRAPFIQLLVAVEKDYIGKEFRYKGGLEILFFKNMLAARIGYVNATFRQPSAGLGLTLGKFEIDYAIMPRQEAPRFDQFTLKAFF